MQIKDDSSKTLDLWLGRDTWHTDSGHDMPRFFRFVDAYQREHGFTIDEPALREEMERRAKALKTTIVELSAELRKRISLMYSILDFLKETGR